MKNEQGCYFWFPVAAVVSMMLLFTGSAMGSGFAIIEQSASAAGYAYAGAAAAAQDASTIFFNPAGMALQSGNELQIGAHYIIPKAEFKNQGSTTVLTTSLSGSNGGDGGDAALVPNLFYMHEVSPKWKAGIGITAPYGLVTEYDDGWVGRYYALRSELATLNINPSVAYKINDQWSLGAGVSFQRAEAELTKAIDWGTAAVIAAGAPSSISQNLDGTAKIEGDDWGVGANVGLIFEPLGGTRFGLHYRSKIDHTLEGDATFDTPPAAAPLAAFSGRVNTHGNGRGKPAGNREFQWLPRLQRTLGRPGRYHLDQVEPPGGIEDQVRQRRRRQCGHPGMGRHLALLPGRPLQAQRTA
jgi:long-chain fatty acid transport protein